MTTVGKLAKKFGISRSTLLYYDRIDVLRPSERTDSQYRHYSESDERRLAEIQIFKSAGIGLLEIKKLLDKKQHCDGAILRERLKEISVQIDALRMQQHITATLLGMQLKGNGAETFSKSEWTTMLEDAGFTELDMYLWHHDFELQHPQKHARFLKSLGISKTEISQIRERSRVTPSNS